MLSVTQNRQSVAQVNVGNAVAILSVAGRAHGRHRLESRMFGTRPMDRRLDGYSWQERRDSSPGLDPAGITSCTPPAPTIHKPVVKRCAKPVGGLPAPAWAMLVVSRAISS